MGFVAKRSVMHGRKAVEGGILKFKANGNEALEHAVG